MKLIKALVYSLLMIMQVPNLIGCPTCIGRLKKTDDPFFSHSFAQTLIHQNNDTDIDTNDDDDEAFKALQEEFELEEDDDDEYE